MIMYVDKTNQTNMFLKYVFRKQNMCASPSNSDSVEQSRYAGCVVEWYGNYGLISCMKIESSVRALKYGCSLQFRTLNSKVIRIGL